MKHLGLTEKALSEVDIDQINTANSMLGIVAGFRQKIVAEFFNNHGDLYSDYDVKRLYAHANEIGFNVHYMPHPKAKSQSAQYGSFLQSRIECFENHLSRRFTRDELIAYVEDIIRERLFYTESSLGAAHEFMHNCLQLVGDKLDDIVDDDNVLAPYLCGDEQLYVNEYFSSRQCAMLALSKQGFTLRQYEQLHAAIEPPEANSCMLYQVAYFNKKYHLCTSQSEVGVKEFALISNTLSGVKYLFNHYNTITVNSQNAAALWDVLLQPLSSTVSYYRQIPRLFWVLPTFAKSKDTFTIRLSALVVYLCTEASEAVKIAFLKACVITDHSTYKDKSDCLLGSLLLSSISLDAFQHLIDLCAAYSKTNPDIFSGQQFLNICYRMGRRSSPGKHEPTIFHSQLFRESGLARFQYLYQMIKRLYEQEPNLKRENLLGALTHIVTDLSQADHITTFYEDHYNPLAHLAINTRFISYYFVLLEEVAAYLQSDDGRKYVKYFFNMFLFNYWFSGKRYSLLSLSLSRIAELNCLIPAFEKAICLHTTENVTKKCFDSSGLADKIKQDETLLYKLVNLEQSTTRDFFIQMYCKYLRPFHPDQSNQKTESLTARQKDLLTFFFSSRVVKDHEEKSELEKVSPA